jgi:capsular polysaccharide transport system permease protein
LLLSEISPDFPGIPAGRFDHRTGFRRREMPARKALRLARRWLPTSLRIVLVLLPTILAGVYYGCIATDLYVSEARFVIRTATKPASALGGLTTLLQLAGMSHDEDDAYAVRDFLRSRDALVQLEAEINLRGIYHNPDADILTRYPSFIFSPKQEDFYRYFKQRLSVVVNNTTGVTTLRVEAFNPADAGLVARKLLDLGERLVNKLNDRMQQDTVHLAEAEVEQAEQRRIANQIEITRFRNDELILDPDKSAAIVVELIGKLATTLAEVRAQIAETRGNAPDSPQLGSLRQRAAAIEDQITIERDRVGTSSEGLANKIAKYETLMLQRQFAIDTLSQSVKALQTARIEARRQQMYLERVVAPDIRDKATMPRRWRTVLTVLGFNVIGFGVLWLLGAGLREHAAAAHSPH